jgi:hypothetical protein
MVYEFSCNPHCNSIIDYEENERISGLRFNCNRQLVLILQPASRAFGNDVNRTITHFGLSRALAQRLLAPLLELLGLLVLLLCVRSALDKPD